MAVAGDELGAVVADELARGTVFADGCLHCPPCCGGGEATCRSGADGEARVVVENVDDPGFGVISEFDLGAVDLPQIVGCVAFEAPLGRGRSAPLARCDSRIALQYTMNFRCRWNA